MKASIFFLCFILLFSCCDKEKDYRDKYCGDYLFQVSEKNVDFKTAGGDSIDFTFLGKIEKYSINKLLIKYSQNYPWQAYSNGTICYNYPLNHCEENWGDTGFIYIQNWITPNINEEGKLTLIDTNLWSFKIIGEFSIDTINLEINFYESMALNFYHKIKGIKQ